MPTKAELEFLHDFEAALKLMRAGKIKAIQLCLGEKPGITVSKAKEFVDEAQMGRD